MGQKILTSRVKGKKPGICRDVWRVTKMNEKKDSREAGVRIEGRRWEMQQRSFNISSEMIYLFTLWQPQPSGLNQPTNKSLNPGSRASKKRFSFSNLKIQKELPMYLSE